MYLFKHIMHIYTHNRLREETLGDDKYTFIEGVKRGKSCTLLVRGPNKHSLEQIKSAVPSLSFQSAPSLPPTVTPVSCRPTTKIPTKTPTYSTTRKPSFSSSKVPSILPTSRPSSKIPTLGNDIQYDNHHRNGQSL